MISKLQILRLQSQFDVVKVLFFVEKERVIRNTGNWRVPPTDNFK